MKINSMHNSLTATKRWLGRPRRAHILTRTGDVNINYKIVTNLFFVISIFFCGAFYPSHSGAVEVKDKSQKDNILCALPEDISKLEQYLSKKAGSNLSLSSIEKLRSEFSVIKDDTTTDFFYSKDEKVRLIGLSKKCIAPDGVEFEWKIAATVDMNGRAIFHQLFLIYAFDDMLNGRRKFSFENFRGSNKEYSKLISNEVVGILNATQTAEYMKKLGAAALKRRDNDGSTNEFVYKIDPKKDMASRIAAWNFSKRIIVRHGTDQMTYEVVVRGYQ